MLKPIAVVTLCSWRGCISLQINNNNNNLSLYPFLICRGGRGTGERESQVAHRGPLHLPTDHTHINHTHSGSSLRIGLRLLRHAGAQLQQHQGQVPEDPPKRSRATEVGAGSTLRAKRGKFTLFVRLFVCEGRVCVGVTNTCNAGTDSLCVTSQQSWSVQAELWIQSWDWLSLCVTVCAQQIWYVKAELWIL